MPMLDLECDICDLADMANVVEILVDKVDHETMAFAGAGISAKAAAEATAHWRETALFAVRHLQGMAITLKKNYYEGQKS